ncbi:MAG: hypothetical protein QOG42_396 [Solirubrobacteraceae bacterium]|nr:hypothetical protein [Solirubrobacteraceae bacterium]
MALIGYGRVSALEEETWRQHDALESAGCTRIFTDRASGAHEERPELARCFDHLREGDVLVVTRLDRLGRSLRDLVDTVTALGERGVAIRSLDKGIDTTGPDAAAVLGVCAALAEFELDVVRERTALAAVGIREPRLGAFVEAARSLPPWRAGPAPDEADAAEAVAAQAAAPAAPDLVAPEPKAPAAQPPPLVAARPPRTAARRRALIAVQIGVTMAAAVAAFHVARSGAESSRVDLTHTAANRDAALRFPDGWRRTSADLSVTALGLDGAIVLAQGRAGGSMLMAGMSPATGATLLPPAVLRASVGTPHPVSVRLGGQAAQRFADVRLRDRTRRMTVIVIPTTRGALTLACVAKPGELAALRPVCDRVAQSLRPTRGRALPLGPSVRYQGDLDALVGALDTRRAARRAKLASVRTASQQARVAQQLSSAYAAARAAGAAERVSPREAAAHRRILTAIDATRVAYARLAGAARSASATRFDRARAAVAGAEGRLRTALAALRPLGYEPTVVESSEGS